MPYIFNPLTCSFDYYQASSGNLNTESFTSTGGVQTVTVSTTPVAIIMVVLNGQFLTLTDDYTVSGVNVTLTNPNIPSGLSITIIYTS